MPVIFNGTSNKIRTYKTKKITQTCYKKIYFLLYQQMLQVQETLRTLNPFYLRVTISE